MARRELDITIFGEVRGTIWMPSVEATQTFKIHFSKGYERPFASRIDSLRDALLEITNNGDFQNCGIDWAVMEVTYHRNSRRITFTRELQPIGENADCFATV